MKARLLSLEPEWNKGYKRIISLLCTLLILGIFYLSREVYIHYQENNVLLNQRGKISGEIMYWEQVVNKYTDYRDGYFKLAVLYYQMNNLEKSKENLQNSLKIDPNYAPGRKLEEQIGQ